MTPEQFQAWLLHAIQTDAVVQRAVLDLVSREAQKGGALAATLRNWADEVVRNTLLELRRSL